MASAATILDDQREAILRNLSDDFAGFAASCVNGQPNCLWRLWNSFSGAFRIAGPRFVQMSRLGQQIFEYRSGVFEIVASEAIDRSAAVEKLQPEQWRAV
jgi:hypothetical protein